MVGAAGADLSVQLVGGWMRLDEVVRDPLQLIERGIELAGGHIGRSVFDQAPGEHGRGGCHGQPELHVIAGVVPAAGEIAADVRAVLQP